MVKLLWVITITQPDDFFPFLVWNLIYQHKRKCTECHWLYNRVKSSRCIIVSICIGIKGLCTTTVMKKYCFAHFEQPHSENQLTCELCVNWSNCCYVNSGQRRRSYFLPAPSVLHAHLSDVKSVQYFLMLPRNIHSCYRQEVNDNLMELEHLVLLQRIRSITFHCFAVYMIFCYFFTSYKSIYF